MLGEVIQLLRVVGRALLAEQPYQDSRLIEDRTPRRGEGTTSVSASPSAG